MTDEQADRKQTGYGDQGAELAKLMVAGQQGDRQAYQTLLQESSRIMRSFLIKRLGDAPVVDDIVQEALMGVHKARHTYDPARPYIPWLLSVTKYKYIDYLRKWSRTIKNETLDDEILKSVADQLHDPDEQRDLNTQLSEALAQLPPKQRQAFELLKVEGFSVKEAAAEMGVSESALKVSAHRAYKALRQRLRVEGYED